jgi:hypothetical protein
MNEKKSFPFKLRVLSWIPTVISMVLVVPLLLWVLLSAPPGILLCKVDGSSMDTALHHGQYVYQDGRDFSTGDIVICRATEADGSETALYNKVWQAGVILLPIKSVGVMGDERTYERAVALRAVTSTDAMTADWAHLPYDFMAKVSNDIINKVKGVNRVCYDISSKPPATIEWE